MTFLGKLLGFLLISAMMRTSYSFNMYNRIDISNKTGASCLDGSTFGYYLWYPDQYEPRKNKLLIYFEQTPFGWCLKEDLASTAKQCYKFMTEDNLIDFGSSKNWAGSEMFLQGVLSPFDGGEFNAWTKVFVRSCDGGLFMGNTTISYRSHQIHFKGNLNIVQMFKSLQTKGFMQVEQVVIGGSMNGATAALMWSQTLKQYTDGQVSVLADSAIHLNASNQKTGEFQFQSRMVMFTKLALQNGQALPNQECYKANIQMPQNCLFGLELANYISSPIFFTQSLYDGWSIGFILGYTCAEDFASLSQCPEAQRQIIIDYHQNVTRAIRQLVQTSSDKKYGIFAIACVSHQFLGLRWNVEQFEVPMNSGNSPTKVVSNWVRNKSTATYFDEVQWPNNKPCARKS